MHIWMQIIFQHTKTFFMFPLCTATLSNPCLFSAEKCRVFRPDRSYAVTQGKWYFEFEVVTVGSMRVGWARPGCTPDKDLGADDQAYVFDGFEVRYPTLRSLNETLMYHFHKTAISLNVWICGSCNVFFFFFLIIKPILVVRGLYVSVALRHFWYALTVFRIIM